MKRIISILMVVAMMLSALLAVIPASATEGNEPAPVTYKVNWKRHYDNKWMRGQWYNDSSDAQNKYENGFKVIADNNSISSEFIAKDTGHNYSYYSTKMFEITADTKYEYTFKAKNNAATTKAGVIFAYDPGTASSATDNYPYFVYGSFQNKSSEGEAAYLSFIKGHPTKADGKINNDVVKPVLKLDNGYGQFKVVYEGLTVKFYYLDFATGNYVQAGSNITLPAGSKVCFGVYSAEGAVQNTLTLKDCVLTVVEDATAKATVANTARQQALDAGNALKNSASVYTASSFAAFTDALAAAEAADALQDYVDATLALEAAIDGLKVKAVLTSLEAAIAKAEAIRVSDYTNGAALTEKINAAKEVKAEEEPDQAAVDAAIKAIEDAIKALTSKKKNLLYLGAPDKVVEMGNKGLGNVSYIDYHKYVADKKYTAGQEFPKDLAAAGDAANKKYVLRMADSGNVDGEGTAEAIDGVKHTASRFSHQVYGRTATFNGKKYDHGFGYSFINSVTADEIAFYLPENTNIESIDIYGAVKTTVDGTVLYGKALEGENVVAAPRTYLGTIDVTKATIETTTEGTTTYKYKVVKGYLTEARKLDYIFFALTLDADNKDAYRINEIELYGIENPADFSKLSAQMDNYHNLKAYKADYTAETWAKVEEAITANQATIESVFSAQTAINDAATAIETAIKGLALATAANKTALDAAIKAADAIVAEKAKYKDTNWAAFTVALKNAKDVFSGTVYSQSAVDKATSTLKTATLTLVKIGDKTALKTAIDTAKTYTKEKYSGDAMKWALFDKALKAAEAVYASDNVDQTEIDDAKAELESTQSKLVESTPDEGTDDEEETEEGEGAESEIIEEEVTEEVTEGGNESTDAGKKKKCGSSVAVSALAIVGVIGTALVIKKKED